MADKLDDEPPIGEVFSRISDDAKAYAAAEIAYFRELAVSKVRIARAAAVFGAIALMFGAAALIAVSVGAVMVLTPMVGPLGATVIVAMATLLLMGLFGWLAWKRVSEMMKSQG